jgi:hypothetical protein
MKKSQANIFARSRNAKAPTAIITLITITITALTNLFSFIVILPDNRVGRGRGEGALNEIHVRTVRVLIEEHHCQYHKCDRT